MNYKEKNDAFYKAIMMVLTHDGSIYEPDEQIKTLEILFNELSNVKLLIESNEGDSE